jgi:kinesin family member C1
MASRSSSTSRPSRMSLGGHALRDASSIANSRRNRRISSGGHAISGGVLKSETPIKDRHAIMEEYRMQKRHRENDIPPKSLPIQNVNPSPRPVVMGTSMTEGSTALERFRLRKLQKLHEQEQLHISVADYSTETSFATSSQFHGHDNADETTTYSYGGANMSSTPNRSLAYNNAGTSRFPSSRRKSFLLPPSASQESSYSQEDQFQQPSMSQQSIDTNVTSETVESVARVTEMQKRVDELMKEKMGITMAMAPLEARFRQKEDAWLKEQNRLLQEIESCKLASRLADDKYRDLELQFEGKEEENRNLRLQVRKESSTFFNSNYEHANETSVWSRQLQNDRDVVELRGKLQNLEEEMTALRLAKVSVEKELHATKIELDAVIRSHEELQDEYDDVCISRSDSSEIKIQLERLKTEHMATSAQLNAVYSDFAATKAASHASILSKEQDHKLEVERLQFEMSVYKTRAAKSDEAENKSAEDEDFAVLKARIEERDRKITDLEKKCFEFEEIRRQMHNRIQELRGNIRVFVRTRPFLPNDEGCTDSAIDVSLDGETLNILDSRTGGAHDFKFDKVFPPSAGQDQIFDEVSDFVQSALDGYNVCLFSYGQTGSGKTHTMQGSGNSAMRGIIPRAVEKTLSQVQSMQSHKWNFTLRSSFLEIYNEELKDLLASINSDKSSSKVQKLSIKRSREGASFVEGLSEIPIDTSNIENGMKQLDALMSTAARVRSVACTKMNSQSSRSHSVFMLHLRGYNEETGAEVHGSLNLCDLAGSERLDRSGAGSDAQRLRETQAINKSLSCLGDVFNALSQGSSHIPYRNSKLTFLLQDCLSGDGKALMFVNLSPTTASSSESLCSLRFAQRVNQVELGKATKHIQYSCSKR